ncbi:hypothetical protein MTO96_024214 [Rhipicephalus appendiculatus]
MLVVDRLVCRGAGTSSRCVHAGCSCNAAVLMREARHVAGTVRSRRRCSLLLALFGLWKNLDEEGASCAKERAHQRRPFKRLTDATVPGHGGDGLENRVGVLWAAAREGPREQLVDVLLKMEDVVG